LTEKLSGTRADVHLDVGGGRCHDASHRSTHVSGRYSQYYLQVRDTRELPIVQRLLRLGGQRRFLFDTVLLAVAGVAAAQLFNFVLELSRRVFLRGIAGYLPPGLPSEGGSSMPVIGPHGVTLVLVTVTLGGLIVGVFVEWLAPEAEGHGTDALIRAFHRSGGALRGRVAPVKLAASAITIGSGGAAGREGPIALVAATIGSWYAGITGRDERDRRLLMLVGAAAGLSAIFRSPIGAAFFVIEVLYVDMEFESRAMLYAMLAAVMAYALNGLFVGWGALFVVPQVNRLRGPADYGWYALLGVVAGLFSTVQPLVFYRTRDLFRALPVPRWLKPAIGAALTGVIILAYPQVIAGGYGWIQRAIDGGLTVGTMAMLSVAELIAMSFTVASGGSGGVFAPSLFMGAMLGGAIASGAGEPTAPFVVVGMAAVFAGAGHVPVSSMFMVTEMTGGYTLLVPAALAVMLSYLIQITLSRRMRYRGIYEAQVASRGDSPAHHTQHLEIALRILREKHPVRIEQLGEIDLVTLLRSGIPVELPDDFRLFVGVLRKDSPLAGTTVSASGRAVAGEGTNILGILRGDHMIAPRADVVLTEGDRIIVLARGDVSLRAHLDPW
jgi:CIC family chloride channel protein